MPKIKPALSNELRHVLKWTIRAGGLVLGLLILSSPPRGGDALGVALRQAQEVTYYVRPDGGSATQCTGRVNAPYPGSGMNRPCAWDHPFRALPPGGSLIRIAGGDSLIIASGSYMMGYGAPGAENCDAGGAFDCYMPPIPSGPSPANPTRILGDSQNPPELWGTERPWFIINLTDASNIEIGYLEITDHSGCVEFHTGGLACERDTPPYGAWASAGLYAEDSANVYLHHLNIHGLASIGVHAGRLTDWTVEDVRIAGNGSAGWDGDLWDEHGDSNSGTLTFRRWTVEWNGCGETYPGKQPTGCWAQSAGGYGDGFATGASGGHWIVEDSIIRYNTSDGLDFLYISEPGSSIEIRRTLAEGNAGNQIKTFRGPFLLENSIVVGNCAFFDGQPFTYNVDNCRALGTALAIGLAPGDQATVINNTFTSEGDCLVTAEAYGAPNGAERVRLRNNIFVGQTDFLQPFENTCLLYQETFPSDPFDADYSLIANVKDGLCPGPHDICGVSPGLVNTAVDAFDAHPLPGSAAINAGTAATAPPDDFDGLARDTHPDIGAYEWRAAAGSPTATPSATSSVTRTPGPGASPTPTATPTSTARATQTPSPSPSATPTVPPSACLADAYPNGYVDVVDITLTAQKTLPCRIYLPLVVRQWRLPWTTLSATPTTTTTPSATRSATPTRTANTTATATATVMTTPTATATLLPPGAVTLATLGDSLTEGDGDNFELGGFPGRLLPLLQGRRPASTVTNLGHSGWDSEMLINGNGGVPSQLNQAVTLLNQAAAAGQAPMAMVWIGSNDLWYLYSNEGETPPGEEQQDVQHFTGNIDTILRTLRGAGAAVFIALLDDQSKRPVMADPAIRMAILPGISATEVISMSLQVTRYNQAIAGMAAQHGASTVDFYHTTIFTDTATLNEDGIHPNGAGYDLITQIWFSAMSPLLP